MEKKRGKKCGVKEKYKGKIGKKKGIERRKETEE